MFKKITYQEGRIAIVYTCTCCEEPIYEGDEYFDLRHLGVGVLCESCIDDAHHYSAEREAC